MRLMDTAEGPTDPLGELVSAEQSLRLDYLAFAMDPLGLYRIEQELFVGRRQGTIRTPASLPLSLTSRLWAAIQPLTWWLLCQEALSQIKSRAYLPLCWSFSQHHPRNCVVMALTGLPSTSLSQVSLSYFPDGTRRSESTAATAAMVNTVKASVKPSTEGVRMRPAAATVEANATKIAAPSSWKV
jgi:hypothetical protein